MDNVITVRELTQFYMENRPVGIVVPFDVVLMQAIKAVRYYDGFGQLIDRLRQEEINEDTYLDKSERAVITPLFELYVERENALILEATRSLGVEVYGRTISEISSDITQKELEIQNLAFYFDFMTV